ncbi:acyltransferase family protein [Bacillus sp. GM2]|jgi:peptidoglycan/LPS O-acetylase OafA/YrhL|uniref:Acyltransferase family protein n=2 Tax=Bacillus paralicheniformis TaxID=1648923 RepID=A0AAW6KGP6_9BACI|nr:acyltransferase family protein [Bacillus paralicheniformis]KJD55785.1 peptidoglycan O-acetyltransferase [Bacillus amyloliquefaciens]KUL09051.1 peptidoglycan O-acetyltransferase [Bacillus licheniformis LMG 7559]KUL15678.1 peptidoglycan O-acetyltransferase [Bacillus licheniformis LMG 6934]AGN35041.1 peptidoglycan O-acetyltransferase YrhL [Bacillus paralicheniformis ATCC 9945a]AYQ15155.1 acetyltransferase [Bacillus paralicheniformis]
MRDQTQQHRYIPGLDGLRAFAVLAVIAYHLNMSWADGGFIGVDIFFVLSGYLITSIILPAYGNDISLTFRDFWVRRIRRLLPAATLMIFATVIWVALFNRELMHTVRGDAISSLLYVSNWWFIFHDLSYFDSFGSPSPLKNLWSLAIEEQFYFIWPIILLLGIYIFKKRERLAAAVVLCALCSAVWMSILYVPGGDPSRVYYGTDTRAFELLIGCALALVWPMKRLSGNRLPSSLKHALHGTELAAFALLMMSIYFVDEFSPFLYHGGMLLISIIAAILIACVSHPSSFLGFVLSVKPLRWIGKRSYGIYLWHYPVIVLSTPVQEIGNPVFWHVAIKVAVTFILAELSYRFIEKPIRQDGFKPFVSRVFLDKITEWKTASVPSKISIGLMFAALLIFAGGLSGLADEKKQPQQAYSKSYEETSASADQPADKSEERKDDKKAQAESGKDDETKSRQKAGGDESSNTKDEQSAEKEPDHIEKEVLAVGDSVMLDIASSLRKKIPGITIDGQVGRQVREALQLTSTYASFNHSDKAVVIELGTNGYFTDSQMDALLDAFSNADVYLVNTRVPRQWESKVNESLRKQADSRQNVTLVDWHTEALKHPEYFTADGVHLMPKGTEALASLIVKAMK